MRGKERKFLWVSFILYSIYSTLFYFELENKFEAFYLCLASSISLSIK